LLKGRALGVRETESQASQETKRKLGKWSNWSCQLKDQVPAREHQEAILGERNHPRRKKTS
jgi:hypothetical protein